MEDITKKCAGLRLSGREGSEVDLSPPKKETGFVFVGKFCAKRRVNLESVARVLRTVWRTEKNFEVSDMGENKVLFLFQKEKDMDRVLLLSPWSFDKYLLVLHKLGVGEVVNKLKFNEASFLVQIHGFPTMCQTRDVGVRIGDSLGRVEKVEVDDKGFCLGNYLQIRVSMDISMPLCRGLDRVQWPQLVVASKYEGRKEYKEIEGEGSTIEGQLISSRREVAAAVIHGAQGSDDVAMYRAEVATLEALERSGEIRILRNP
ncbi:hypothetical protein SO802_023157 [Lithocarpus litseifolius]|uniref:DUF4283 domain-containing protein n=1 Tax=Lithocarpus litseifolius TaxID=425828 RepID=A0AAW2C9D7_9ROSI